MPVTVVKIDFLIDFLMIIHTAAASFYVPFNMICSYVLQLKTSFIYFTNIYLYQFFTIIHFFCCETLVFFLPWQKPFSSLL